MELAGWFGLCSKPTHMMSLGSAVGRMLMQFLLKLFNAYYWLIALTSYVCLPTFGPEHRENTRDPQPWPLGICPSLCLSVTPFRTRQCIIHKLALKNWIRSFRRARWCASNFSNAFLEGATFFKQIILDIYSYQYLYIFKKILLFLN